MLLAVVNDLLRLAHRLAVTVLLLLLCANYVVKWVGDDTPLQAEGYEFESSSQQVALFVSMTRCACEIFNVTSRYVHGTANHCALLRKIRAAGAYRKRW